MHLNATLIEVGVSSGIVNEFRNFALAHLRCPVTKNEEKSVDGVGLS